MCARSVGERHHRNAVDVVDGHHASDLDEARVPIAAQDSWVHRVGYGRVTERRQQEAAALELCGGVGRCSAPNRFRGSETGWKAGRGNPPRAAQPPFHMPSARCRRCLAADACWSVMTAPWDTCFSEGHSACIPMAGLRPAGRLTSSTHVRHQEQAMATPTEHDHPNSHASNASERATLPPQMVHRIAVGVNGYHEGLDAAALGAAISRATGAAMMLVAVHPDPMVVLPEGMNWRSLDQHARKVLAETRDALAPEARVLVRTDHSVALALHRVMSTEASRPAGGRLKPPRAAGTRANRQANASAALPLRIAAGDRATRASRP